MKKSKILQVWGISLMVISVITLVIAITRILDIAMPDTVIRMLGMIELIALPVFAFSTVKRFKEMKEQKEEKK